MLRSAIRMLGVLFGFLLVLLVVFGLQEQSRLFPGETDRMVVLDTSTATISKAEIVDQLNDLARNSESPLIKPAVSLEDSQEFTLFLFGDCSTAGSEMSVWSPDRRGVFRCSHELGDYPAAGTYAYNSNSSIESNLRTWVRSVNISIVYSDHTNLRKGIVESLGNNGMGILILGTIFALSAVAMAWIVTRAESRRIRYTAGVPPWRVHSRDVYVLMSALILPMFLGVLLGTIFALTWTHSWSNAFVMLHPLAVVLVMAIVFLAVTFFVLSALAGVGKSLQSMRSAKVYAPVRRLGALFRLLSIILVALALPYAASYTQYAWDKAQAYDAWRNVSSAVVMNFAGDPANWEHSADITGAYVEACDKERNVYISTVMNLQDFGGISPGGFKKLVIANTAFLDAAVPDWRTERVDSASAELQSDFLATFGPQLEVWLRNIPATDLASNLYITRPGQGIPSASLTTGQDQQGDVSDALVLVVDDATSLSRDFLASGLASHWVFFADKERALESLAEAEFSGAVSGTEYVAAEIASISEAARNQAIQGAFGALLALAGAVVISFQGALSWAHVNRRRIFALRSYGTSLMTIARYPIAIDLLILLAGLFGAYTVGVGVYSLSPFMSGALACVLGLVYVTQTFIAYRWAVNSSFERTTARNY